MVRYQVGIYSSAGKYTCAGRFGSLGYEEIDAKIYAEWGIDYLSEMRRSLSPLDLALSSRHQNMTTAITRARVGFRSYRLIDTPECLAP